MRRFLLSLLLLWPLLSLTAQERWCPEPTNRLVNDYSGMLSDADREALESRLVAFDDSTSNQILVIITPTLNGEEIMDVGTRIGTQWGVGQKDLKNGLVILIKSKTEEEDYGDVAILPGYGLEGALPDAFCRHIIDDQMIGPLGEGDYYRALNDALDVIEPVCRGEYNFEQYRQAERRSLLGTMGALVLIVVVVFILADRYNRKHPHDYDNNDSNNDDHTYFGGFPGGGLGGYGGFGGFSGGRTGGFGGFGGFGGGSFGGGGAHGRF